MNGANSTTSRNSPMMLTPRNASGLLSSRRRQRGARRTRGSGRCGSCGWWSVIADPRGDEPVDDVDEQVDEYERHGEEQYGALHDRVVTRRDGVDEHAAPARPGEHGFRDDRSREQRPEFEAADGEYGHERVPQGVLVDDGGGPSAFGTGRAHVILPEYLK